MQQTHFIALDCETTGLSPEKDNIIEVGAVKFSLATDKSSFDSLFNPNTRVPEFVARLTGITDAKLATAPQFAEKRTEFAEFCRGATIIGHNLPFDLAFLTAAGVDLSDQPSCDTFLLAGLLLPRGESLSLAALAARFGCEHREAHRALADAEATRDLFRALIALAQNFSSAVWHEIAQLSTTEQSWSINFAELVQQNSGFKSSFTLAPRPNSEAVTAPPELTAKLSELADRSTPTLLETAFPPRAILAAAAAAPETPTTIFFGSSFAARATVAASDSALLFAPRAYVCHTKLKEFADKPLTPPETTIIAKLLLHPDHNFSELVLSRTEILLFDRVAADENCGENHTDCQLFQAKKRAADSKIIISDHTSLPSFTANSKLKIVVDAADLPANLIRAETLTLDLPTLELFAESATETLTLWWGLLGLLFREAAPKYGRLDFMEAQNLANFTRAREVGQRFLAAAEKNLPRRVTLALQNLLENNPDFLSTIRSNFENEIFLAIEPRAVALPQLSRVIFTDAALTAVDDFAFVRRLLQLPTDTPAESLPITHTPPEFIAIEGLPDPASAQFSAAVEKKLFELLRELRGHTIVIFGSRRDLTNFSQTARAQLDCPVLTQNSPPPENPEKAIFLKSSNQPFPPIAAQNCILVKLPFRVRDGADFRTETLPASALAFKKVWQQFAHHSTAEKFFVLDPRLRERGYGRDFEAAIAP